MTGRSDCEVACTRLPNGSKAAADNGMAVCSGTSCSLLAAVVAVLGSFVNHSRPNKRAHNKVKSRKAFTP